MTIPTQKQRPRIIAAISLMATTIVLFCFAVGLISMSPTAEPTNQVTWKSEKAKLNDANVPSAVFRYDDENDLLIYRGKISSEERDKLLKLSFHGADDRDTRSKDEQIAYRQSIDELTFLSNVPGPSPSPYFLMCIGALGGIIGVQARSVSLFILHTAVLNDIELDKWWPWYCLRPLLGMIFGPLVVPLILADILPSPSVLQTDALNIFVYAVLVGVVANMFFNKVVQLAQTFFGLNSNDAPLQTEAGSTRLPVKATGKWVGDPDSGEALITWTASTDKNLSHYEVRMAPGATYEAKNATVLATLEAGVLEYRTKDHPSKPGETVSFKVYLVFTDSKEVGSEAVPITRSS